jgi:16S rRNA processing protein RimM
MNIEESVPRQKYVIIKFKEVPDMNAAEEIKGGILEITREELHPLPENTYYIFDIIGLNVRDLNRGSLGRISDVLQTGSNDVYVVETGARPVLIPALKQVVKEIDLPSRSMVVDLPGGWLMMKIDISPYFRRCLPVRFPQASLKEPRTAV